MNSTATTSREQDLRSWFQTVVTENYRYLYVTAYRVLQNPHDAEDATQGGIMKAFGALDELADPKAVLGWLARIVRNTSLDHLRKGGRARTRTVGEKVDALERQSRDDGHAFRDDERRIVFEEVHKLSERQVQVLTLLHLEGLTIAQVADRLGITINTARVRLFRAYERLRTNPRVRRALAMEN